VSGGRIGVFLDRDGTLNEERDFIRTPDDLHLIPGAAEAVRKLNARGLVVCVISNQSGVARGYLEEKDLVPIHAKLEQELRRGEGLIDRIYYCPHHPTAGRAPYNIECACRKPKPGMLLQGAAEFGIDLLRSFVVGDSIVDVQAGGAVGARTVLVRTGYGMTTEEEVERHRMPVTAIVPSIVEGVDFILTTLQGKQEDHE
jgi:D-glycero-D-manno-heptose 1,7-bisphosphate phosphatase